MADFGLSGVDCLDSLTSEFVNYELAIKLILCSKIYYLQNLQQYNPVILHLVFL
jgi:hypothetical protein